MSNILKIRADVILIVWDGLSSNVRLACQNRWIGSRQWHLVDRRFLITSILLQPLVNDFRSDWQKPTHRQQILSVLQRFPESWGRLGLGVGVSVRVGLGMELGTKSRCLCWLLPVTWPSIPLVPWQKCSTNGTDWPTDTLRSICVYYWGHCVPFLCSER